MRRLIFFFLFVPLAFPQQQIQVQRTQGEGQDAAKKEKAPDPADVKRAKKLLSTAEAESGSFEPASRSYLCFQTARGYLKFDRPAARELLLRCFTASKEIDPKDDFKHQIQGWIVKELLQFGPETAQVLLPQVEGEAKSMVRAALIKDYTHKKDFDHAIAMVNEVRAGEEDFPYAETGHLMLVLPEERSGDKRNLFSQALTDYRQRPSDFGRMSAEDMGTFVVRFALDVPPAMALEAIDEVLKHAQPDDKAKKSPQIVISSDGGSAAFRSKYELRLFQVLPALQALDPSRAESLLKDNQQAKELLARYPQGFQSLAPRYSNQPPPEKKEGEDTRSRMRVMMGDEGDAREQGTTEELRRGLDKRSEDIVKDAEKNPRQAIAQAVSLPPSQPPMGEDFRLNTLDGIAQALLKKNPQFARAAVDEMLKILEGIQSEEMKIYLANAARHLIDLGEKDAAGKAIAQGMAWGKKLHEKDENASDPNQAIRPFWPSADCWRSFTTLARRISSDSALEAIKSIDDPEIVVFEKINLANALLGLPTGMRITREKRKSGQDNWSMDTDD